MMLNFTAAHDDTSACNTCCCEKIYGTPGTTEKVQIDYAAFSVPIGSLQCGTQFALEQVQTCPLPATGAPTNTDYQKDTLVSTPTTIDLSAGLLPIGAVVTYALVPFQGPYSGTASLVGSSLTYTPTQNFTGYDTLWYKMTDADGNVIIKQVSIQVRLATSAVALRELTPAIIIPTAANADVNARMHSMSFPLNITPRAQVGEVYRLTVRQGATDCNYEGCYFTNKCFDIVIGKC